MPIYDISLPLQHSLPMWPGDTPFSYELSWQLQAGASVNLGSVAMSVHAGTHADAPFHFQAKGQGMGEMDLSPYIGPAVVIDVRGRKTFSISDVAVEGLRNTPRVLLQTGAWSDLSRFPETFPVMESDVPAFLHSQGVVLVGVDAPSVDAFHSKDLPNHHSLALYDIRILESLYLAEVPAGHYELISLPLKLMGADGSPVRAILRSSN